MGVAPHIINTVQVANTCCS